METYEPTYPRGAMYALIAIQFTAVVLSIILLIGLLIPLIIQLKKGTYQRAMASQRRQRVPPYSTYNAYLMYLALLDLAYFLPLIAAEICTTNEKFYPRFFSWAAVLCLDDEPPYGDYSTTIIAIEALLNVPYGAANVWINTVIAYEVLVLLQATSRAQRINQPSLTKVNLQCGGVFFCAILFGTGLFCLGHLGMGQYSWLGSLLVITFPLGYVMGVSIWVIWKGYIPPANGSTPRDRAVRGLTMYFFRIVMVFVGIWLPVVVLGYALLDIAAIVVLISEILMAIQPILTFCVILSKDDVKKYITDLVTLTYLFGDCTCLRKNTKPVLVGLSGNNDMYSTPPNTSRRTSILGYTFTDVSTDLDDDVDTSAHGESDDIAAPVINGDGKGNHYHANVESKIQNYKSRRLRGGAVTVLATGEAVSVTHADANAQVPDQSA